MVRSEGTGSDPDGVTLRLSGPAGTNPLPPRHVDVGGASTFTDLAPGSYRLTLDDVSTLCAPVPAATFDVAANRTAELQVELDCVGQFWFVAQYGMNDYRLELVDAGGERRTLSLPTRLTPVDIAPDGSAITGLAWVHDDAGKVVGMVPRIVTSRGDVIPLANEGNVEARPVWSPAGDRIADWVPTSSLNSRIALFDPTTGAELESVGEGWRRTTPQWSSDGRRIAYAARDSILVYDTGSGTTGFAYAHGSGYLSLLGWSADGRYMVVLSTSDGERETLVVDLDAGSLVATVPADVLSPIAWHPTAPRFLYTCFDGSEWALRLYDAEGGTDVPLIAGRLLGVQVSPSWSEDGTRILLLSAGDIVLYEVATGTIRQVIDEPYVDFTSVRWAFGSGPVRPNG